MGHLNFSQISYKYELAQSVYLRTKKLELFSVFNIHIISHILETWGGFSADSCLLPGPFCDRHNVPLSVKVFSLRVNQHI